jgi:hypothetical protein
VRRSIPRSRVFTSPPNTGSKKSRFNRLARVTAARSRTFVAPRSSSCYGSFQPQPPGDVILAPGDVIVAMGTSTTMDRLESLFAPAATTTKAGAN